MEQPMRIPNRIPVYDYSQSGAYFVTICAQDRKPIFSNIVGDGFPVPKIYGKIAEAYIRQIPCKFPFVCVDKYVIMPDHIHILLRIAEHAEEGTSDPSPTIGKIMGWFKYQTTKQVNSAANTAGQKIFQRSYYDHVVRNQQDYNEIWEYIENNPRKWAMTKQGRT